MSIAQSVYTHKIIHLQFVQVEQVSFILGTQVDPHVKNTRTTTPVLTRMNCISCNDLFRCQIRSFLPIQSQTTR